MANSTKVEILEYEKGWGSKIDEIKEFVDSEEKTSLELAKEFIKEFNSVNDKPVTPDWYMRARLQGDF